MARRTAPQNSILLARRRRRRRRRRPGHLWSICEVHLGCGARVDRYFLLVPRIVRPKRSPLLTGSPWALALPRVHKRLEYLDRRGRSAIHLERRRGADPPDAAPVRE